MEEQSEIQDPRVSARQFLSEALEYHAEDQLFQELSTNGADAVKFVAKEFIDGQTKLFTQRSSEAEHWLERKKGPPRKPVAQIWDRTRTRRPDSATRSHSRRAIHRARLRIAQQTTQRQGDPVRSRGHRHLREKGDAIMHKFMHEERIQKQLASDSIRDLIALVLDLERPVEAREDLS
jgi:hypothetical protein